MVDLLIELRRLDMRVWVEGESLRFDAPTGVVDDALRARVRERRQEIVAFLEEAEGVDLTTAYIPMRDGVELAADIFRPFRGGALAIEPLPVIWCHERYHRSDVDAGVVMTKLESQPWLRDVVRQGYVVAAVDARGTGSSSGTRAGGEFGEAEIHDGYDITEWLAAQAWCSGRVGMYGDSYLGIAQYLTASTAPPHLRAIFPQMAMFDLYSFIYPGGVFRDDFVREWGRLVRELDTERPAAAVSGFSYRTPELLAEHRANRDVLEQATILPHRDSADPETGCLPYDDQSPASYAERVCESGVAVYLLSGWYDLWARDAVLWFRNLDNPKKLVVGGWMHTGRHGLDLAAEHVRWYDYWLKGIDNGVMSEPPIRYWTFSAPAGTEWRSATGWPPPEAETVALYLGAGPSGTVDSTNDGLLRQAPVAAKDAWDEYAVDYTASSGTSTRWTNGYGGDFRYHLTVNDPKALTYTSPPLADDLEVTGHPIVHLYVTSSHEDGDFFVYLEEVDEEGESHYVTEGVLRASHRQLAEPPFDNCDLPYHPSSRDSMEALPPAPVELVFDLHPTSNVFVSGRRIRISVTGCDKDNACTPVVDPPPLVRVHRDARHQSRVLVPVVSRRDPDAEGSRRTGEGPAALRFRVDTQRGEDRDD